jgi:hypothetical protein
MNKQTLMFENSAAGADRKYSSKIDAPIYEPSHAKPHLMMLCDSTETKALIREIDESDLPGDEKEFLRAAAWRHAVFHYESVADYYAHATPEMQRLMEKSALVIIDFDSAIDRGFVRICNQVRMQFLEEYNVDDQPAP